MSKKYILIDGKKVYLHDEKDGQPVDDEAAAKPEGGEGGEGGEGEGEGTEEAAKQLAKKITKEVMTNLGIDNLKEVGAKVDDFIERQNFANSKIKQLLHGKDLIKDRDQLTKEEKIVGFFHALVTKNEHATKALAEGVAADGGYLFPDEFAAELVRPLVQAPRMRGLVRVVTMRRDVMQIPTTATRPKVYWTAENATKTTTTATFGQATLTARKAAAILYASDELIEDSDLIDVVQTIIDLFAEAIGDTEDQVITAGNGTTQPTGIVTATAGHTVTCSGNLDFDDIIELIYSLPAPYRANARFLVHSTNIKELRKLKDSQGRYLWADSLVPGQPDTIHGYPVQANDWLPEARIYFGDWKRAYWLGDRKQMTVKVTQDTETAFTRDQTAIRVVVRIAGNVVLADAVSLLQTIP